MHDRASWELARQWDARNLLPRFPKQFYRPAAQIGLDRNSLGRCFQEAERPLQRVLHGWKTKWSDAWRENFRLAARVGWLAGSRRSANWSAEAPAGRWKF